MMDWCFGHEVEDFLVPGHEELFGQLPASDSWSQWGMSVGWPNSCGASKPANVPNEENCLGMNESTFQLNDSTEADQMDDIFLNSLMQEDFPGKESSSDLFYLSSESRSGTTAMLDAQSIPSDVEMRCFSNQDFSQSASWESREISMNDLSNSNQADDRQAKETEASDHTNTRRSGEEASLEESVLQELEAVLTRLNEGTRLCFRDSFFRLAHNSSPQASTQSEIEGTHIDRSETPGTSKSETNSIDRVVANLVFNRADSNTLDLLPAISAKYKHKQASCNYSWDNEEILLT